MVDTLIIGIPFLTLKTLASIALMWQSAILSGRRLNLLRINSAGLLFFYYETSQLRNDGPMHSMASSTA